MNYLKSTEFRGSLTTAFTVAVATLGAAGFAVATRTDRTLEMTGPGRGCGLGAHRQSVLSGFSRVRIAAVGGRRELEAETGGRRWAQLAVPVLAAVITAAVVAVQVFTAAARPGHAARPVDLVAVLAPLAAIIVVAVVAVPLAIRAQRARVHQVLDALLNNMVTMGRES